MTTKRLATLAVLFLQLFAIFGGAKDVVLCVGQAGHVAVEDAEASRRCHESSAGLDVDATHRSSAVAVPAVCVDTPLPGPALERANSPARGHDVVVAAPLATALPLAPFAAMHDARTMAPPPPSARILRSVVLLI